MAAGWGRGGWSSGKYGLPTSIDVTGVAATGAVGSVTITEGSGVTVSATGVAGTGAVGSVTITQGTGVTIAVTGVAATGAVGSVVVQLPKTVSVTGVSGTSAIGSVTVTEGTGVSVSATGVSATGSVGSVSVETGVGVNVTGESATGSVGSVTATGKAVVSPEGVEATIITGGGQVWGLIDDSQTITWTAVNDSQTVTWTAVDDSQTVTWTAVDTTPTTVFTVTVASKTGGGNAFYIDGVERPVLTLTEGKTYKFDLSDGTTGSHPFRLSTTSDGTHGGGSIYSDGVTIVGTQGQSGAYLQIVVATDAPTLHYFCTAHSGMGNEINTPVQYTSVTLSQEPDWQNIAA